MGRCIENIGVSRDSFGNWDTEPCNAPTEPGSDLCRDHDGYWDALLAYAEQQVAEQERAEHPLIVFMFTDEHDLEQTVKGWRCTCGKHFDFLTMATLHREVVQ